MANNDVLSIQKELKELLLSKGVSDVGFSYLGNADSGELQNGISIVVMKLTKNQHLLISIITEQ